MHGSSSSSSSSCSGGSKDDDLVLSSSQDSSSPGPGPHSDDHHHHLQLGLGLTLSPSTSSSSSDSLSSSNRTNVISRTNTPPPPHSLLPPSQVVGWPPLGTYRMNSFNSHVKSQATEAFNSVVEKSKSNGAVVRKSADSDGDNNHLTLKEKGNLRSSLFVKVNMDGVPIGRKVDLSAYTSYENLAQALEDMFNEPTTVIIRKVGSNGEGHGIVFVADGQSKSLDGSSNFVLTYKDKEGDWMLVGDVPWWMFLITVRRLRITRTSEANGIIAPRLEEKNSRLKNKPT